MRELISAAYCLNLAGMGDRDVAIREDVDFAFRLLARKFDFISALMSSYSASSIHGRVGLLHGDRLDRWLLEEFSGERLTRAEILQRVHQLASPPSDRSVERHLASIALQTEHGYYEFPDIYMQERPCISAHTPGGIEQRVT